jgi:hypothetical protein
LPTPVPLELWRGDDFPLDLTVTNYDGSAANLTGATAAAQVRISATDTVAAAVFTATISGNVVHLKLPHAESVKLLAGTATWDCQLTQATGDVVTLAAGNVLVKGQVTP